MRYIIPILIVVSCSSPQKNNIVTQKTDENLGWINSRDFDPPKQVKYSSYQDLFPKSSKDSLSRESLARAPQSVLSNKLEGSGKDKTLQLLDLCYKKKVEEAFKIVKKEYKRHTKHPAFWNAVGNCYMLENNSKKAMLFYQKANEIDPRYTPAHNNMGVLYQREGKFKKAYDTYHKALKFNNFSSTPLFNMAQLDLKHGFVDKSLNSFLSLYKKDPEDIDVLNALAIIYLLKNNFRKSLEFYERIDNKFYKRGDIGINLAITLYLTNNKKKAKSLINKISLKKNSPISDHLEQVKKFMEKSI